MTTTKTNQFSAAISAQGQAALDKVEGKRGYTLPYHRLFAAHAPQLLTDYDQFHESLTLAERDLTPYERETVWSCLLAAKGEKSDSIHLDRAKKSGLDENDLARCITIAAICRGFEVHEFAAEGWAAWTSPESLYEQHLSVFQAATTHLPVGLAHLSAVAAMAARRRGAGVVLHLGHAINAGVSHAKICEALSYLLLPCGGNVLIDIIAAWEEAADNGILPPPY